MVDEYEEGLMADVHGDYSDGVFDDDEDDNNEQKE